MEYDISRNNSPTLPAVFTEVLQPSDQPGDLLWAGPNREGSLRTHCPPVSTPNWGTGYPSMSRRHAENLLKVMQFNHSKIKTSARPHHTQLIFPLSFPVFISLRILCTEPLTGSRKSRNHHSAVRKQEAWEGFTCLLTGQGRMRTELLF